MRHIQMLLLIALFLLCENNLHAQCNPDVTPPTPHCKTGVVVQLSIYGTTDFWATDLNNGSFDNCPGPLSFRIEELPASASPPTMQSIDLDTSHIGTNTVAIWAVDQAGNGAYCTSIIEVIDCQVPTNPTCDNLTNVSLNSNGTASILPDWIFEGGPYCYHHMGIDFVNGGGFPGLPYLDVDTSHIGTHNVVVYDSQSGNSCWGTIQIEGFGGPNCNPDVTPPVAVCDQFTIVSLGANGEAIIAAETFDDGSYDSCLLPFDLYVELGLPPSNTPPSAESITFDTSHIGINQVVMWVVDQAGNSNYCMIEVEVKSCFFGSLTCNASQAIGIPSAGSISVDPFDVLEGGPACNPMGIDFLNGGMPPGMDSIILDTSHIGTTQQVIVYDQITGNSCWGEIEVFDCVNDTINPIAICLNGLTVEMGKVVPHEVTLWGSDFDFGSYDNCSGVEFRLELGPAPSANAPTTESLTFEENEVGMHEVVMWVIDEAGNENYCIVTLEIIPPKCNNDTSPPICTAPADVSLTNASYTALGIDPDDENDLTTYFGEPDADDNCGVQTILKTIEVIEGGLCPLKQINRTFVAIDSSGNLSQSCHQSITVYSVWEVHIPADHLPGDPSIDSLSIIDEDGGLLAVSFEDLVFDSNCDGDADKIVRTWTLLNWCEVDPNIEINSIPRLDLDGNGNVGDGFDVHNGQDSIYRLENNLPVEALAEAGGGLTYTQIIRFNYHDTLNFNVNGTVFHDLNTDCDLDSSEMVMAGWTVVLNGLVSGNTYTTITDSLGQYSFDICTLDTLAEVSLDVPFHYGQSCGTTHSVQFVPGVTQTIIQDIPVGYDTLCPILWVDISTPFLRRCFENYYTVNYCNYSDASIDDVYVEVQLDPSMTLTSSEVPETSLGGNLYTFDLGNLAAGECGGFKIHFDLSCNAVLSATHCVDAHIFPDTLCPNINTWTGANIEVEAVCENDTVLLTVKNTGTAAMAGPLEYIVVEDVIMLNGGQFNLAPGALETMPGIPANGATYRIEAAQEPGHPYPGSVAAAVEGCNGINLFGLMNLFPLENPNPFIATDCQQNIGSFDPNDKQAFPIGYGVEHFIERNTDISYLIRFQNTGTDTAFKVVIIDELDPSLDPASIRPGASSHDYQFELIDGNTLRFTFDDIMLPDGNTNEPASHGFVKFRASQKADLPLGAVIENEAAIYFDFNDPVITNTTFHTLGEHFIEVIDDTNERQASLGELLTYPNPSLGDVIFEIPETIADEAIFILHDALGKQLVVAPFTTNNKYRFERGDLISGIYFYKVDIDGVGIYSGKIILK